MRFFNEVSKVLPQDMQEGIDMAVFPGGLIAAGVHSLTKFVNMYEANKGENELWIDPIVPIIKAIPILGLYGVCILTPIVIGRINQWKESVLGIEEDLELSDTTIETRRQNNYFDDPISCEKIKTDSFVILIKGANNKYTAYTWDTYKQRADNLNLSRSEIAQGNFRDFNNTEVNVHDASNPVQFTTQARLEAHFQLKEAQSNQVVPPRTSLS